MHSVTWETPAGRLQLRSPLLRPVPAYLVTPFHSSVAARPGPASARRPLRCAVSDAPSEPATSTSCVADIDKELVAEKAREGMHRFAASTRKVGATRLVVDSLKRISLTFLGDDHALNFAVAKIVGSRLGWFAVDIPKIICGMRKVTSLDQLSVEERAASEMEVLRGLRTQFRVIATPLPGGAIAREAAWQDLWGSVIVWIDEEDKLRPKPRTAERVLYEDKAEVVVRAKVQKGFAVKGGNSLDNRAKAVAELLLPRLSDHLAEFPELADRKRQYVELGCRGDWPELQPPQWSPVVQGLAADRKPLLGFEEEAPADDAMNVTAREEGAVAVAAAPEAAATA
ncbi:hypothetical protein VOLCADRAFT_104463 [Volvox carteri f. nagariensis]|uniref:Uncharacterized protein n=1 Tax=Volvox carteri f. nagariensis TaxID=3068 RepID=D8TTR6_VOLCA|nr:uncharacterized protein VOLCADRAFT_104463 [Volvox carteri f. nagariensis]EFJ49242.1 hypothetical protein VOLCADRAFT_104463 [Volvox carteri f. nagariensis]|eukprot:XP_002949690.1 hypothetical protein VOLCADRAFT_104463 [Volvox carteri f. nagariensis]